MDRFRDISGLVAVAGHPEAAIRVARGLSALSHRGDATVAMAWGEGEALRSRVDPWDHSWPDVVAGEIGAGPRLAIGQLGGRVDAAVSGADADRLVCARWRDGWVAAAIAGRFVNGIRLRRELADKGAVFHTPTDAELLVHLIAQSAQRTVVNRVVDALFRVAGGWSAVLATEDRLIAVRDPRGFRPLCLGRIGDAVVIASEEAAIRAAGGEVRREIAPGEMVIVDERGALTVQPFRAETGAGCTLEPVVISRLDGRVLGREPHGVRRDLAARLAVEQPAPGADVVVAAPEADVGAVAYARAAGVPFEPALTYSEAFDRVQCAAVPAPLVGRAVVIVANSVATGDIVKQAVDAVRAAGPREIHVRVLTPALRHACSLGVASPPSDALAVRAHGEGAALAAWLGVESLGFLSNEGLRAVLGESGWCTACLTGESPLPREAADEQLALFRGRAPA